MKTEKNNSYKRMIKHSKLLTKYSFSDQFPSFSMQDPEDPQFTWIFYRDKEPELV